MNLIPADRLHVSPFLTRDQVSIRKHRETVKKRNYHTYAEAIKIRIHHPYDECLKVRQKMDVKHLRKKLDTNAFLDFLSRVIPTGQASKISPPRPPPPTPPKMRHGTQTDVTSASVTTSPPLIRTPAIKSSNMNPRNQTMMTKMKMFTMTITIS